MISSLFSSLCQPTVLNLKVKMLQTNTDINYDKLLLRLIALDSVRQRA